MLHIGCPFIPLTHMASFRGRKGLQLALLLRNQTSVVCSDYSQETRELGPQREDEDLSVVWGLKGPLERRERIMTSQGLGIRTPERGLGPLSSLVVVA